MNNMRMTVAPIVVGAQGRAQNAWENTGRIETIQIKAFIKSVRILRRLLETRGYMLSLRFQWKIRQVTFKGLIITIVVGGFGTVPKGLGKGLEKREISGKILTIQIKALLRSPRILGCCIDRSECNSYVNNVIERCICVNKRKHITWVTTRLRGCYEIIYKRPTADTGSLAGVSFQSGLLDLDTVSHGDWPPGAQ